MAALVTVQDLIDQVRSVIDEDNQSSVNDERDIIPALNRGQDYASDLFAKHYEDALLTSVSLTLSSTTDTYPLPEDCFQERLQKVDITINGFEYPVWRMSFRQIDPYETPSKFPIPAYYLVEGQNFRLVPRPTGTYPARLWYLKEPDELVKPQGRIVTINAASNYVYVDAVGEDLTTESDSLKSYVNLIDAQSGRIKASMQIASIADSKITFRTIGIRSTVLNRTIEGDLSDLASGLIVEPDDYLCLVKGTCVPFMKKPLSHFLIQYATNEMRRKLGEPSDMEQRILDDFKKQVEGQWAGRENTFRVKGRSALWNTAYRRFFTIRSNR